MRIALLNWSDRRFGGTGTYLGTLMPALSSAGHEVSLWHELSTPVEYPVLPLPPGAPKWSVSELGVDIALTALREWNPDVLYAHGLVEPSVERKALDIAPAVFFAHNYYGTCVSGLKAFKSPVARPCSRTLGWRCLAAYYPRRCGGLNPVTMVQQFRLQYDRLNLLQRYAAIVTHSSHMRQEYLNHGFHAARVINVKIGTEPHDGPSWARVAGLERPQWHLLFVGRMDPLKGGQALLEALPDVARQLGRRLHLTFAGDGSERSSWEAVAAGVCRRAPHLSVEFRGWIERDALEELYSRSDLLVLPSLWPEPLALVGLEARRHGLPVVAYDVGGISDWLETGTNGVLAPGNPPTVQGLAEAIVMALGDPRFHSRLRDGAGQPPTAYSLDEHIGRLVRVFSDVVRAG